jgi:hypothetical protein
MSRSARWLRLVIWGQTAILAAVVGFVAWRQTLNGVLWAIAHAGPDERWAAWEELARRGPSAAKAIPAILEAMSGPDERIQALAAKTLRRVGGLPALAWAAKHPDQNVRLRAVEALSGRDCGLGAFINAGHVRWHEVGAFDDGPKPDLAAAPALREALRDPWARVRECAVDAVGSLGLPASETEPDLVATLRDPEFFVRVRAVHALRKIGAMGPVAAALADPDDRVRQASVVALARLGSPDVLPPLTEALHDRNGWVVNSAADALEQAAKDNDPAVRESARTALLQLSGEVARERAWRRGAAAR